MSPRIKKTVFVAIVLSGLPLVIGLWAYRASQRVPEFYAKAIVAPPDVQQARGAELERRALELHNQTRRRGRWELDVTADQLNGWLAADLPRKFPGLLPPELLDPRVAIDENRLLFACRHQGTRISTVISLTIEVGMAETPNTVFLRLVKARAGLLPLPLKRVLDQIKTSAQQTNLALRWAQQDGDPVALLTVAPAQDPRNAKQMVLESLRLAPNRLVLSGRTDNRKPMIGDRNKAQSHLSDSHGVEQNHAVQR